MAAPKADLQCKTPKGGWMRRRDCVVVPDLFADEHGVPPAPRLRIELLTREGGTAAVIHLDGEATAALRRLFTEER